MPPMDARRVDLYHHYPSMNSDEDKYMVSRAKLKGDISKLQTERAVLASSVTRMQLEVEDIQHHLAVSKNQLARVSKLDVLEKERDALLIENALLRRQQMYQVTAAQQAALSEKVCDCKCKEKSQQDLEGVKRLLNSARKSSIQKIKSLMLELEEHKSLLAEARRERSAATAQLIDLQNENSLIRAELKEISSAAPCAPDGTTSQFEKVKHMEKELEEVRMVLAEMSLTAKTFQDSFKMQDSELRASQQLQIVVTEKNKLQEELHTSKSAITQLEERVAFLEGKGTNCVHDD